MATEPTNTPPGSASGDRYEAADSPQSVMTLDSFIATHPQAWAEMGRLWRYWRDDAPYTHELTGMIRLLSIVGGFTEDSIIDRLAGDFG